MRVLVSVDMEGIGGVVDGEDVSPGHGEYERSRSLITAEANAAVRGVYARDPGAQVLVTEAHGGFRNLVPEQLDRRTDREAIQPLRFDGPVQLEVEVLRPHMTERALLIPGIERTDGCTLRYAAPDFPTAYRVIQLIIMLGGI